MAYLIFLRENCRFVSFGVFLTMASSFGQTFYVALYGADIRAEFELSNGDFGAVFSAASIVAAGALIWLGKFIDRVDIRLYTAMTLTALFAGMILLSRANSLVLFALAIFVVRFCGQGLCVHIASTCMARYFPHDRGKALSVSGMGLAGGEAVLPGLTLLLIADHGWRDAWLWTVVAAVILALLLLPQFLKGHNERHRAFSERLANGGAETKVVRSWTRVQVLRDRGFQAIMLLLMAFPYMTTGVLFHQVFIVQARGWSIELLGIGFLALAVAKVLTSLVVGSLIDRVGAVRLVPATCLPWIVAFLAIFLFDNDLVMLVYLALFGMGIGMLQPILSAMLAERYGVANLGGIKAMSTAGVVLAAAAAPATVGWLLDAGVSIDWLMIGFLAYLLPAAGIAYLVLTRERNEHS
ncbi:MAG: MFS transporter [Alphaproteobacteria bacterium]|nr:MFS transporter [Alphaproteobacteria bacterium]